ARAGPAAGPLEAFGAGEGRAVGLAVYYADLPVGPPLVRGGQACDDLLRAQALPQQRKALRPVARVGVGLGRDRADAGLGPRDDRAYGEELRLRRDSPLSGLEIAGRDRISGDELSPSDTPPRNPNRLPFLDESSHT